MPPLISTVHAKIKAFTFLYESFRERGEGGNIEKQNISKGAAV